ncbi:MAG: rod shape-determining protein MreD [Treponema sp.]|nr:rod shape-determining protein MreD [Treponema sp.]
MTRSIVWAVIFGLVAAILQSTLLSRLAVYGAKPDLVLGIIVYSAYVNGMMTGQLSGFFCGIVLDFLTAAPFGLNAFIRVIIGALTGLMKGTFFLDIFILPMTLCAAATIAKAIILFLLNFIMGNSVLTYQLAAPTLWVELAFNTLTAPILFAFLRRFKFFLARRS